MIWAIVNRESGHENVLELLINAADEGPLVISPIAFAELAPSAKDVSRLTAFLARLSIFFNPITPEAAYLAGSIHKKYRLVGGPRVQILPDFIIAAHAQTQANRLATLDHGYLRKWFPELSLLMPTP